MQIFQSIKLICNACEKIIVHFIFFLDHDSDHDNADICLSYTSIKFTFTFTFLKQYFQTFHIIRCSNYYANLPVHELFV